MVCGETAVHDISVLTVGVLVLVEGALVLAEG